MPDEMSGNWDIIILLGMDESAEVGEAGQECSCSAEVTELTSDSLDDVPMR